MAETSTLIKNEGAPSSSSHPAAATSKPAVREGFASCIRCGTYGVKDCFYGRGKQYCSANCVKGTAPIQQQQTNNNLIYQKIPTGTAAFKQQISSPFNHLNNHPAASSSTGGAGQKLQLPIKPTNHQINQPPVYNHQPLSTAIKIKEEPNQDHVNSVNSGDHFTSNSNSLTSHSTSGKDMKNKNNKTSNGKSNLNNSVVNYEPSHAKSKTNSFDWCSLLNKDPNFRAAPVSSFKHVPASNLWDGLISGNLKVEVRHKDAVLTPDIQKASNDIYWIASVVKVNGYYFLLRFEGYEEDSSADFWINIYNPIIHPVGFSAAQKKHLIPPKSIAHKQTDWKQYLVRCLMGAKTLPPNFVEQIKECLKSNFRVGMKLEVVDKARISSVRLATINKIIGCRLHVIYDGLEDKDSGFWCHQQSSLIHPVGWAQLVGHELRATSEYAASSLAKARNLNWTENDADFSYFPHLKKQMEAEKDGRPASDVNYVKGMKLEAIDPLNLSTICCATITKVLRYNYLMVGIDGMMAADGSDWFCYHASSSNIFPVGTCNLKKLPLTPPRDYPKAFNWFNYMRETKSNAAPVALFNNEQPVHGFQKGMYLEAVDLMEPRLICVAMVKEVVGRLLKIHFNGWDDNYDQFLPYDSPEIYPIGWCEMVGYPLEPPREDTDPTSAGLVSSNSFVFDSTIKKRGKQTYKGGRSKKRKRNTLSTSDKMNGSGAVSVQDEELASNYIDDQDNCTLFNSTIDDEDGAMDTSLAGSVGGAPAAEEPAREELTRNSSVVIRPSPLPLNQRASSSRGESNVMDWSVQDVVDYFESNDLGAAYSNSFLENNINGRQLLKLAREDVWQLMQNKLGPSLKCYTLLEELKKNVLS